MKKRITALLAAVSVTLCTLVSCSSWGGSAVSLTYDNGNLIDKANGITYINAPMCFEPIATETEPYGECSEMGIFLYGIMGLDTSLWLSEQYDGIGSVYYAQDKVTLPDIVSFEANEMLICTEELITVGLGSVTDKADIDSVIDAYLSGDSVTIIPSGEVYKLKLTSDKYEGIYFNLVYIEAENGENYIYDRSVKNCVAVGDVLCEYLPRTEES